MTAVIAPHCDEGHARKHAIPDSFRDCWGTWMCFGNQTFQAVDFTRQAKKDFRLPPLIKSKDALDRGIFEQQSATARDEPIPPCPLVGSPRPEQRWRKLRCRK